MSGGVWEYVMGIMTNQSGQPLSGKTANNNSGFVGILSKLESLDARLSLPEEKYYDMYAYGTNSSYFIRGHLGDVTVEMSSFKDIIYAVNLVRKIGSWYSNHAYFLSIVSQLVFVVMVRKLVYLLFAMIMVHQLVMLVFELFYHFRCNFFMLVIYV